MRCKLGKLNFSCRHSTLPTWMHTEVRENFKIYFTTLPLFPFLFSWYNQIAPSSWQDLLGDNLKVCSGRMPSLQLYKTQNTQTSLWVLALILLLRGEVNVNIIFSIFQLPVNPIQSGFVLFVENQKIEVLKRSETYWSIFSIHR